MNQYVLLAKEAVQTYLQKGVIITPKSDLPEEMFEKAGVFVTIEKDGKLRGCIGTFLPTKENIAQEIIANAIATATEDYRFGIIKKEELSHLSYSVSVLKKPERVKDLSELDPEKYGIMVKTKNKSGLLLPNIPGIGTKEEQIEIVCQKANIDLDKEKITIFKFKVKKYD